MTINRGLRPTDKDRRLLICPYVRPLSLRLRLRLREIDPALARVVGGCRRLL